MNLADKIRQLREDAEMSQEDLAHRAGVSVKTIWRYENGEIRRPHVSLLRRVAVALGKDADFFAPWMTSRPKNWYARERVAA